MMQSNARINKKLFAHCQEITHKCFFFFVVVVVDPKKLYDRLVSQNAVSIEKLLQKLHRLKPGAQLLVHTNREKGKSVGNDRYAIERG